MTKEITKANVLQEMQDKFKMREFVPEAFTFSEQVVPVYDIERHFEAYRQKYDTKSITATGAIKFFDTPANAKWNLKRYDVVFMTGAFTIAGVYIVRKNRYPSDAYVYLDLTAAQNTSYHKEIDVELVPGDAIYVNVDGYTSTGDLRLYIDYKTETIR